MTPGTVVMHGDRLCLVLAHKAGRCAVAPVMLGREKNRAGYVALQVGRLGAAVAMCGSAGIEAGPWTDTGITVTAAELAACQAAAARANSERSIERFAPLAIFSQACPSFRSGGRRVGRAAAGA